MLVIMLSQDVSEPANTAQTDRAEEAQLAGPPVELLIEHKIENVYALDGPDGAELKAMEAEGERLGGSSCISTK